jgi:hypothetical protein
MTTIRRHPLSAATISALLMLAAILGPALHELVLHGHEHDVVADHCDHDHGDGIHAVDHEQNDASHDAETCSICSLNITAEFADSATVAASPTTVAAHSPSESSVTINEIPANRTRGSPAVLPYLI